MNDPKKKELKLAAPVQNLVSRFERVEQYNQPNTLNMHENWRYYWAINPHLGQGQWPASSVPKMVQAGRQLTQYNFILPIIDSMAANIGKMPIEPEFIAMDRIAAGLTEMAKHMMYSDRELMDWAVVNRRMILHGLIFEGNVKMFVSDYYNELGNIGLELVPQGSIFYDPFWRSGRRQDLKRVYKKSWMTAEDILQRYPAARDNAEMEVLRNRMHGHEYGAFLGVNLFDTSSDQLGSGHIVYEEYYMMPVERKNEIIAGPQGEELMPDIPDEDKPAFLDKFYPGWDKTAVYEKPETVQECFLRTAIPTLCGEKLVVDNERIEVQVGSPPFWRWAASMENGQCRGMVDSLKDPQTNYNFIAAEILRKIQSEGGGGAKYVDYSLFRDTQTELDFEKHSNRTDKKFPVKPGTFRKGLTPSQPVETTGPASGMYEHLNLLQNQIIPNVSKRPPITMGQVDQGGRNTSGRLYRLMGIEADTQTETMVASYREVWNSIYEAYLLQSGQTYSNEMLPREFSYKGDTMVANEPIELSNGQIALKNDIRGLLKLRHKVIISEKQASPSSKANTANFFIEYLSKMPQENPASRVVVAHQINKNLEIDEEAQAELEKVSALEMDVAVSRLRLEKADLDYKRMQIEGALRQMQPVPGAMQGAVMAQPVKALAAPQGQGGTTSPDNQPIEKEFAGENLEPQNAEV